MKTGHRPNNPKSPLGSIQPLPMDTEAIKAAAWREHGLMVVSRHDVRLGWADRKTIENIGNKLYGVNS